MGYNAVHSAKSQPMFQKKCVASILKSNKQPREKPPRRWDIPEYKLFITTVVRTLNPTIFGFVYARPKIP
jgi:hypothetical protein